MAGDRIYKVFVSSTFEDLREERAAVQKGLLQLGCLPVGMELFPAADDETWNFIKSQIDDCDYYVVVVAGRYGSQGPDGISFTEMEYDYAASIKKPTIGFVHAKPGDITAAKTEQYPEAKSKLENFLAKVRRRPVRQYTNPHELALEVTTSFVQLIRDRPAVGYVRTDQSVDFKRYSELLEENNRLREQLRLADASTALFPSHAKQVRLAFANNVKYFGGPKFIREMDCSLARAFAAVAEGALQYDIEDQILGHAAKTLLNDDQIKDVGIGFMPASVKLLRRELILYGLVDVVREDRSSHSSTAGSVTQTVTNWKLTDYGRRQLAAIAP